MPFDAFAHFKDRQALADHLHDVVYALAAPGRKAA
jgi:hypothetical protein